MKVLQEIYSFTRQVDLETWAIPFSMRDPTIGFRCALDSTDLQQVAFNYRKTPFSDLYEAYLSKYQGTWYPYRGLWNAIYFRYLDMQRRSSAEKKP